MKPKIIALPINQETVGENINATTHVNIATDENISVSTCENIAQRRKPPNRRRSETIQIKWPPEHLKCPTYFISASRDKEGHPYEVFIASNRPSSPIADVYRDASVLLSIALQCGTPLAELSAAITRLTNGEPASLIGAVLDELSAN